MKPERLKSSSDDADAWQLQQIEVGLKDLDAGRTVSHEKVSNWLRSWGKPKETKAPRSSRFF